MWCICYEKYKYLVKQNRNCCVECTGIEPYTIMCNDTYGMYIRMRNVNYDITGWAENKNLNYIDLSYEDFQIFVFEEFMLHGNL